MTDPAPPLRRRPWIWGALTAVILAGLGAWYLGAREGPPPEPAPSPAVTALPATTTTTTTVETTPASTAASSSTTSVTTAPAVTTTVAVARPTTTVAPTTRATTTTVAAPTTTEKLPVPDEAGEHEHHDEAVQPGDVCHTHGEAVLEHCHTHESPPTTAPDPAATGDCPGNYRQWYKVRDECVLSEVRKEYLAWRAGTHAQRMAAIRDGHLLAGVFASAQAESERYRGYEAANDPDVWTSVWADLDTRSTRVVDLYGAQWTDPDRIDVRIRAVMADGSFEWAWNVVPFTYVDGQWKIGYQGFCRFIANSVAFVEQRGGTLATCPPDPRPGVVEFEYVIASYDPTDDPTRTRVNRTPGW